MHKNYVRHCTHYLEHFYQWMIALPHQKKNLPIGILLSTSLLEYFPLWRRKTHTLDYRLLPLCFPARNSERDGVFLLTQSSHSTQHTAFLFSIALRSLFMRHLLFLPKSSTPTPY